MVAVAVQLSRVALLLADLAAVLPPRAAFLDDTGARRMRALLLIGHVILLARVYLRRTTAASVPY